jgi:two-component system, cell cycle sensor histidine kinase and response regulator CckA
MGLANPESHRRNIMAKDARGDFYPTPVIDQGTRPGAIARLTVFVIVLTASAILIALFRERLGEAFLLGLLGILAMIGVGFLFAAAIGFVTVTPRAGGDDLSKSFVDTLGQGLLVTDAKGRVLYANKSYADLTGATSASDLRTAEALLSDNQEAASTIHRIVTPKANSGSRIRCVPASRQARAGIAPRRAASQFPVAISR